MAGKTREDWKNQLLADGVIDTRGAFTMSNIKSAPNGEYGLALLCVKGNTLSVYDTDFSGSPLGLLYSIDLDGVSDVKISTFPLWESLKFKYRGYKFNFNPGFSKGMPIVDVFKAMQEQSK